MNFIAKPLYDFLKFNRIFRRFYFFTIEFFNKKMVYQHTIDIVGGKAIVKALLNENSLIFSAGVGLDFDFEHSMISEFNARIIALDPTETAANFIEEWARFNKRASNNIVFLKKALTTDGLPVKFYHSDSDYMASTLKDHRDSGVLFNTWESLSIHKVLIDHKIDYLKIDIEGSEYDIIDSLKSLDVPQVSIEFHHFCSESYSLIDTIRCINKMISFGYEVIDYGSFHGRARKLPKYVSLWKDNNVELLFIKANLKSL
jgi:FkbM family methyltransferase